MEMRYNEADRARAIYERYVRCLPDVKAWVRFAKFEMQVGYVDNARRVYERAVQELDGEPSIVSLPTCYAAPLLSVSNVLTCTRCWVLDAQRVLSVPRAQDDYAPGR